MPPPGSIGIATLAFSIFMARKSSLVPLCSSRSAADDASGTLGAGIDASDALGVGVGTAGDPGVVIDASGDLGVGVGAAGDLPIASGQGRGVRQILDWNTGEAE